MAVTKTPRKKPAAAPAKEAKPAAKTKAAPAKRTAPKPAETEAPAGKAPSKPRSKAKAEPKALPPAAEPAPAPVAKAPQKKTAAGEALPPLAAAMLEAIREGRAVELLFADADANAPRTFEPRHLTYDALSQAWYVWGWDRRYNAERHHCLDLLAEVNPVEGAGRAAQGPFPEGTPANQIGGWLGGEPIPVKAVLFKHWVFAVKQAPPAFPQFKLEEQGDGQAQVSFTATDLRAIARWVMQFGDGIQVLEPARLADRIKQVGAVWAGRERQIPAPAPRPEPAPEPKRQEPRPPRETRQEREREREREETPKGKAGKVEVIRFDRL